MLIHIVHWCTALCYKQDEIMIKLSCAVEYYALCINWTALQWNVDFNECLLIVLQAQKNCNLQYRMFKDFYDMNTSFISLKTTDSICFLSSFIIIFESLNKLITNNLFQNWNGTAVFYILQKKFIQNF